MQTAELQRAPGIRKATAAIPGTKTHLDEFFALSSDLLALGSLETHTWVRVNPAFQTILGWCEKDLVGQPFYEIVHPADMERSKAAEANLLKGRPVVNFEHRMMSKRHGYRWIAWDVVPHTSDGLMFCVGRDVTRSRRTLHALRARNSRMLRSNEELEQFAKTAGHDLQEPLRTLSLYSQLLLKRHGPELPEEMSASLVTILQAAGRMQALVASLLEYARVSEESGEKRFKTVSVEAVFGDVLRNLESAIRECFATITHDPLPDVHGDEAQICRLLQNLLSNSLKYRCKDRPVTIHLGVEERCGVWHFHVTDNGRGFAPEYAERIFMPFKRLQSYEEIPGTGLGLAICRRVLERHGGRIWAEGKPEEGARFWFTLPRCFGP